MGPEISPEEEFEIRSAIQELQDVANILATENFVCRYEPRYLGSLILKAHRILVRLFYQ